MTKLSEEKKTLRRLGHTNEETNNEMNSKSTKIGLGC